MINYFEYIKKLKDRHPKLSPLNQLLQIDYLSCESIKNRLISKHNFDQTQSSLLLYAIFLHYLEIPECSKLIYDKNLTVEPSEISDCIKSWEKVLGTQKPPKSSLPLYAWVSGYTVLCDVEPKGSIKLLWNGIVQTDLIRPKLRERLKSLTERDNTILEPEEHEEDIIPF